MATITNSPTPQAVLDAKALATQADKESDATDDTRKDSLKVHPLGHSLRTPLEVSGTK